MPSRQSALHKLSGTGMEDYMPIRVPANVDSTECTRVFGFFRRLSQACNLKIDAEW
ncbi:hypothetical protein CY34DRAFT_807852 [Suillus luteus UH-Slu-Lm8-n1]|uniref:Uncharacterized protein n=1 Tax=Suillus luteus UH-Slu-Lm8-n1 TaxID=930992 RepID=A0A0D0ADL8_9AGAM|nr:hypothetical protein CY34DRAFT_807852 [Suillus luteus UH-Slu-Lm8-n1]